ncbi:MAG: hypothetical protein GEU99_02760 [Luteitalea sp.]|nr:hypothetical protein [Luteitalea sp.]
MATGSLKLRITDLLDRPIEGRLQIDFQPERQSPGGTRMAVTFSLTGETTIVVNGLQCRGGPGTLYAVRITSKNFRPYAFFQLIAEQRHNTASDGTVRLMTNPKRVKDIEAPSFSRLRSAVRRVLDAADMQATKTEDRDLSELRAGALYGALGPLRKASLLNIFTKASHVSSDRCARFLSSLTVLRQDRCFCAVDATMPEFLRRSAKFRSARSTLHQPLSGFVLEDSFKSADAHANLQVTFMRHQQTGALSADVDIDESRGIEHGFEVIRNAVTSGRTNPYLIRELMLLSDPVERSLVPGYRFVFG